VGIWRSCHSRVWFFSRGQVDPETQQYFSEISRLVGEGGSVEDPEERAAICASALEEAKGKELELSCNSSCGRVLETLLLNSEISLVVSFLERCTHVFASMSMDPGGSHVVEAALKSVAASLREDGDGNGTDWYPTLERALSRICEVFLTIYSLLLSSIMYTCVDDQPPS
jgi:hypothetical protein